MNRIARERQFSSFTFIINPISGGQNKKEIPQLIEQVFKQNEIKADFDICFTESENHATEIARQAIKEGVECIVAVGGDGTVNEVAKVVQKTDAVLAIIPKGSGNGLARELSIPLGSRRALELILEGEVKVIDSCQVNDLPFFCTFGVGFDAEVSKLFASDKHRGSLAYVKKAVEGYLNFEPEKYEITLDGNAQLVQTAFLVTCANASQYGNDAYIAPLADIMDGFIDITVFSPFTHLDVPQIALQLFTKQLDKNSKIKMYRAKEVHIRRKSPGIVHLDGEPIEMGADINIRINPQALKVLVPQTRTFIEGVRNRVDTTVRNLFPDLSRVIYRDKNHW